jgi:hypothetical protein
MALELFTTITRTDADGDQVECDATVYFTAECTNPGCAPSWDDPVGAGAEYAIAFERAELETRFCPVPGTLSESELATLRAWFVANHERACEAANDRNDFGEREPANDNGWRGLEAT